VNAQAKLVESLEERFFENYTVLSALRRRAFGDTTAEIPAHPQLNDVTAELKTDALAGELRLWADSFAPTFAQLDAAAGQSAAPALGRRTRSATEWSAGIQAEDLALSALSTRLRAVSARRDVA
jgi:hypothetical protein